MTEIQLEHPLSPLEAPVITPGEVVQNPEIQEPSTIKEQVAPHSEQEVTTSSVISQGGEETAVLPLTGASSEMQFHPLVEDIKPRSFFTRLLGPDPVRVEMTDEGLEQLVASESAE